MNRKSLLISAYAALMLAGCAYFPQQANLDPNVSVMRTTEGEGITVAVKVVDERPTKSLGRRGTGIVEGAEITATLDLAVVVHDEVVAGLKAMEFVARSSTRAPRP